MKLSKFIFLFIILFVSFTSCSSDDNTNEVQEKEEIIVIDTSVAYEESNISYGDDENQNFDLYLPANRTVNTKTVILVHGGGWTGGDKKDMEFVVDLMKQDVKDVAIVNINYRLADENNKPYPMQINDISTIVKHLKDNKIRYSISDDLGFIGLSAGAHLSLLWSYAFDTGNNVNMVSSIVGPTNFTDPAYVNASSPELEAIKLIFGINSQNTAFLEEVSPFHRVTASAPPTALYYAGQDELVPTTQGTDMRDKLASLNVTHEFTLYPDVGHGLRLQEILETWTSLKIFMDAYL